MTTLPFSAPKQPDLPPTSDRYFEATIPAPKGKRFDERVGKAFEGLALVLVGRDGKPASAGGQTSREVRDLRVTVKTILEYRDSVFGYVRGYRIRQEGERIGIIFEPQGRADGRVEGVFCDLMTGLGVTEVAEVTQEWKTSEGLP